MRTGHFFRTAMACVALLGVQCALAQTLYKLIDKYGKITYSEEKPKNFDGQVVPMNIDTKANTATLPKSTIGKDAPAPPKKAAPLTQAQIDQARERLERAQAALKDAKDNQSENDTKILGNKGGGVRFVESDEYKEKMRKLEQEVKDAEENLARLQKGG